MHYSSYVGYRPIPTTVAPTTMAPTTEESTTQAPTTEVPPATAAPPVRRETTAQDIATTSSVPFISTAITSDDTNTDSNVNSFGGDEGLSPGDVSAVVLSTVIVAIILSVAVLMLVLFFRRKKRKSMNVPGMGVYICRNTGIAKPIVHFGIRLLAGPK